jgi:hypothetical protein
MLFECLKQENAAKLLHSEKITAIINEVVPPLISQIVQPIRAANGTTADLMIMLLAITHQILTNCVEPAAQQKLLDMLYNATKGRLGNWAK